MNQDIRRRHQLRDVFAEAEEAHAARLAPQHASGLDRVLRVRIDAGHQQRRRVGCGLQRREDAVETFDLGLRTDPQPGRADFR